MPLFSSDERKPGIRFPMGRRGMHQISLRVVDSDEPPTNRTTYSNSDDIPETSFEKLQKQMISQGEIVREAMNRKTEEIEASQANKTDGDCDA